MSVRRIASIVIPRPMWRWLRVQRIIMHHRSVASFCNHLIRDYHQREDNSVDLSQLKKRDLPGKIIWQYWSQGFDDVPEVVGKCLNSIEKWKGDYTIIRLDDHNLEDYIQLPDFILQKKNRGLIPLAQFSDILRVCLLSVYGGLWLDATILLTGPIPRRYSDMEFFVFQRDPDEPEKEYWENAYAYYFGWSKGFHVNMLNSVIFAKKESAVVMEMTQLLLLFWKTNDDLPDYFFFQILFDIVIKTRLQGRNCVIESDCKPHFLQQSINDSNFSIMDREGILSSISIHKLTYK